MAEGQLATRPVHGVQGDEKATSLQVIDEGGVHGHPDGAHRGGREGAAHDGRALQHGSLAVGQPVEARPEQGAGVIGEARLVEVARRTPTAFHDLEGAGLPQEPDELVEQEGVAAGCPQDLRLRVWREGAGVPIDLREGAVEQLVAGGVVERRQAEDAVAEPSRGREAGPEVEQLVAADHDHRERASIGRGPDPFEQLEHDGVGEVGIVDDGDERLVVGRGLHDAARRGRELVGQAAASRAGVDRCDVRQVGEAQQLQGALGEVAAVALAGRAEHRDALGHAAALLRHGEIVGHAEDGPQDGGERSQRPLTAVGSAVDGRQAGVDPEPAEAGRQLGDEPRLAQSGLAHHGDQPGSVPSCCVGHRRDELVQLPSRPSIGAEVPGSTRSPGRCRLRRAGKATTGSRRPRSTCDVGSP